MGADTFLNVVFGETADAAFRKVVDAERYENGHADYTGTIAEKDSFVMIGPARPRQAALDYARKLIDEGDKRIDDKWGPAGCIEIAREQADSTERQFLFFGWASS